MGNIEEMSHEQILALTENEIQRIYDYMCAERGIRFVVFPAEPEKKTFEPDDICYEVNDVYTQDIEVATKISKTISDCFSKLVKIDYNYRVGSEFKFLKKNISEYDYRHEIKTHKIFKAETYESLQNSMTKFQAEKAEYEAKKKEYDEYRKKRESETAYISQIISAHHGLNRKLLEYKSLMDKYIELSSGDKTIALNFFKKALSENEWRYSELWFLYKMGYLEQKQTDGSTVDISEIESKALNEFISD